MKFFALLTVAAVATADCVANAAALPNPFSPIPGYPLGNPLCLSDSQAQFLVSTFAGMLANPDRNATNKVAQTLIADKYTETSDSINILAGFPLGSSSFTSKQAYIASLTASPPTPKFQQLDVFHDCTKISFRWNLAGLGSGQYPVKGINDITANPKTGQLTANDLEFNSVAWGLDTGASWTPPPPPPSK